MCKGFVPPVANDTNVTTKNVRNTKKWLKSLEFSYRRKQSQQIRMIFAIIAALFNHGFRKVSPEALKIAPSGTRTKTRPMPDRHRVRILGVRLVQILFTLFASTLARHRSNTVKLTVSTQRKFQILLRHPLMHVNRILHRRIYSLFFISCADWDVYVYCASLRVL